MIFGEGQLKDLYRRGLWGPGRPALERLPVPWEHRAVRSLGRVACELARAKRGQVAQNLTRAFPSGQVPDGRDVTQVVSDAFASHFANQYISFSFAKCTSQTWPQYLAFQGLEKLEAARSRGRGLIIAHPHMGPAQLPLHVRAAGRPDAGTLPGRRPVPAQRRRELDRPVARHLVGPLRGVARQPVTRVLLRLQGRGWGARRDRPGHGARRSWTRGWPRPSAPHACSSSCPLTAD